MQAKHFTEKKRTRSAAQVQPVADRMIQILRLFLKTFSSVCHATRILMGFIIITILLPGTNRKSHRQSSR